MNSKKENQPNEKEINNLFDKNAIQDLKEMQDKLNESFGIELLQASFLNELKLKIYHSLYENHSYNDNSDIINDIIKEIEKFILSDNSLDIITPIIETLEYLMILFLFHFDLNIIKIGYSLIAELFHGVMAFNNGRECNDHAFSCNGLSTRRSVTQCIWSK